MGDTRTTENPSPGLPGLRANVADDQELLKIASLMYDALYTWCGSGQAEGRHA